ncbi:hypothetical protein DLAC_06481 [Tieghemostelium lacteum]|uniref:Carbohydrate binding domain-containing protein n=1 Tax=Tieghemostelium lacteum TaxID=361077 RepID=A0A151ZEZ0_TIELA|nr:hypothetical protein DLAC_06481 [Tieghemostelium lacteum]|eukprot:KYQ92495.1 hypothetical protein DLAC_06481 [Tieghemostelium lacteum]
MNKILLLVIVILCVVNIINADGTYQGSVDFGTVVKGGKIVTKSFSNIKLPATTFGIQALQIVLMNKTSNQPFDHDSIITSTIDFTMAGKKIVVVSASNILTPIQFPSPNILIVNSALTMTAAILTDNSKAQDLVIDYYIKYTTETSGSIIKLTRMASSVVANYSSFSVPKGTGGFTISNKVVWASSSEAVSFMAQVSEGVESMSFMDGSTTICKSTPTYITIGKNKYLQTMSPCTGPYTLTKGQTYTSTVTYDNSIARKGCMGNWGFYVGFPQASTTHSTSSSSHTTTGPSSSHTTTGPSSSHTTTGPSSSGPSTSSFITSSTGGHGTSGSLDGGYTSGGLENQQTGMMWKSKEDRRIDFF